LCRTQRFAVQRTELTRASARPPELGVALAMLRHAGEEITLWPYPSMKGKVRIDINEASTQAA